MKILHIICATLMAVAFASCDEHRDFPDTAMKTCDILCTDGKVVRFEEVKSQNKTPIAVVFYVNKNEDIQGTGYAVYLKDIEPFAYSDSLGMSITHQLILQHSMAMEIRMPCIPLALLLQLQQSLTCGNMVRVPTSLPLLRSNSCIKHAVWLIRIFASAVAM